MKSNGTTVKDNDLRIFRGKTPVTLEAPQEKNFFKRVFQQNQLQKITTMKQPSKGKAVKIVMLTTGSFVVTWVPYFTASFVYVFCDKNSTPERCRNLEVMIASPLAILGAVNSLLNPIIYAWWHKGFRTFIKRLICKNDNISSTNGTSSTNASEENSRKNSRNNKVHPVNELPMENIDLT